MELPRIRVLVVDDEPLARERTKRLLSIIGDAEITGECENGKEALTIIESDPPDVVLLDINMPDLDGMRVIEALDDPPSIILATAYEHHAVRAFELEVTDYLLKPFSAERLERALAKARRQLMGIGSCNETRNVQNRDKIPADTGTGIELIPVNELSVARIEAGVVFLLRSDGESFCFSGPLQELEAMLPQSTFMRASRSALVNLQSVLRIQSCEDGGIITELQGGHKQRISRRRARFFKAKLIHRETADKNDAVKYREY